MEIKEKPPIVVPGAVPSRIPGVGEVISLAELQQRDKPKNPPADAYPRSGFTIK